MHGCFFFFNDTATTEIYTLSLHDALPILHWELSPHWAAPRGELGVVASSGQGQCHRHRRGHCPLGWKLNASLPGTDQAGDRKSTRLNSSHANISYAVFCLKKKNRTPSLSP